MKLKLRITIITLLITSFSIAQIGFEETIITDNINTVVRPESVISTDIDGDGDLDVLSTSVGRISWYENMDGQGNFGEQQVINSAYINSDSISAADIDGDGDIDLAFTSSSQGRNIVWYENIDGLGTFGEERLISTAGSNIRLSIYLVDIDSDGDVDVLSASASNDVIDWYENLDGQGNFGAQQVISNNVDSPGSAFPADIDGDGDIDVVSVSRNDDKIAWYENTDSQGNFGAQQIISDVYNQPVSVFATDVDGDEDIDVLVTLQDSVRVAWFENINGEGDFGAAQTISDSQYSARYIYASDIDGDGDMDILYADTMNPGGLVWNENLDGQGNFGNQNVIGTNIGGLNEIYVSDIDNDGDMDVLSASQIFYGDEEKVSWYENLDGQGNFGEVQIISEGPDSDILMSIYTVDVDNDGDMDVLSTSTSNASNGNNISWYENTDGQGDFGDQQIITRELVNAKFIHAADIDSDGDMDVLSGQAFGNRIDWYENINGEGDFGDENIVNNDFDFLEVLRSIYTVDIDGDGDIDVLSATSSPSKISWYKNIDGEGNFGNQQIISSDINSSTFVYSEDIDGDGDMDVLSASRQDDKIAWYENLDGQGDFGSQQIITTNADGAYAVYAFDIDSDGDMDVISTSSLDNKVSWYENMDGLGDFGEQQIITTFVDGSVLVSVEDVDNDGDNDVVTSSFDDNKISWYENTDGQGDFGSQQVVTTNAGGAIVAYAVNIDNDGMIDILYASRDDARIAWYKNLGLTRNVIDGNIRLNLDSNGCNVSASNILLETTDGTISFTTFSLINGFYQLFPEEGDFTTSILDLPNYYQSSPTSHTSNFTGVGNTETANFCITPTATVNDVSIVIYPSLNDPRPGFDTTYQLVYKNVGTTQLSGDVTFEFDDAKLQFLSASETVSSQTSNTLTFDYTDINPFETRTIDLEFNVFPPPTTEIDDVLVATATINPISGDETEADNVFELEQVVIGSYDPNDIQVLEGEAVLYEDRDEYLHYIIRFQNTGTASAINVNVENVLDDKLDWTTMQLESLSHNGRVEIVNGSDVKFIFNNINLPDSTNDEPNSHGFIAYKIKPKTDVEVGDIIFNTANIFFDFNPAITTNTVATEIVDNLSVNDVNENRIIIYPNPTSNSLTIESKKHIESLIVYDLNGRILNKINPTESNLQYQLNTSDLSQGVYFLEIQSSNSKQTKKFIKK